jgi:hypothetical protein
MHDLVYRTYVIAALFCAAVGASEPDSGAIIWSIDTGG